MECAEWSRAAERTVMRDLHTVPTRCIGVEQPPRDRSERGAVLNWAQSNPSTGRAAQPGISAACGAALNTADSHS